MEIPKGKTRPEIKVREQIIKDFYARWIAENPSKSVWNKSLKAEIKVKGLSYNETVEHAARSYESTMAVFQLSKYYRKQSESLPDPRSKTTGTKNRSQESSLCDTSKSVSLSDFRNPKKNTSSIRSRHNLKWRTKNKSRLGSDFQWGSNQALDSKGLSTLQRNPRDDSNAKVMLFR